MAPELVAGARLAGFPVDVFSFGVLAYELLAGHPPFDDGAFVLRLQAGTAAQPMSLAERVPGLADELVTLVGDCLAWDDQARPTANALLQRLRELPDMPALATATTTSTTTTAVYGASEIPRSSN